MAFFFAYKEYEMDTLDAIHKLMMELAAADYAHRKLPEYLELLERGEEWVKDMREFIGERK